MRQEVSSRNGRDPAEAGVKQESDPCFAAGADDEIRRVVECVKGHEAGRDTDKPRRQCPDLIAGVIDLGEEGGRRDHQHG